MSISAVHGIIFKVIPFLNEILKTNATGRRAWTNKVISLKINFKISTNPLDDLSNYRSRVGEKL
jgi:hypothetical protein